MKEIKCMHCGEMIPVISEFCPLCGEKIITNKEKNQKNKKSFDRPNIVLIACTVCLAIILLLFILLLYLPLKTRYSNAVSELSANKEAYVEYQDSEKRLSEMEKVLSERDETISSIEETDTKLRTQISLLSDPAMNYRELVKMLSKTVTSNGQVAVNSRIYAVKKGNKEKINVSWNTTNTIYLDHTGYVISANWSGDHNVVITGEEPGIANVYLYSDNDRKNMVNIVVICYE